MLFLVNQTPYRVAPGTTRSLDGMPLGAFTYEVISPTYGVVRPRQNRVLAAGDPFRIFVE